jgi:hypothetical protein
MRGRFVFVNANNVRSLFRTASVPENRTFVAGLSFPQFAVRLAQSVLT